MRREPYEFVGGHGITMKNLFEDVRMAELAQRHRMKFAIARAHYLGRVRIQPEMIRRGAYRFTTNRQAMGVMLVAAAVLFGLWLPMLMWLVVTKQSLPAVVFGLWPVFLMGGWYQSYLWALLTPLGIYGLLPGLIGSFLRALTGQQLEWKGRTI